MLDRRRPDILVKAVVLSHAIKNIKTWVPTLYDKGGVYIFIFAITNPTAMSKRTAPNEFKEKVRSLRVGLYRTLLASIDTHYSTRLLLSIQTCEIPSQCTSCPANRGWSISPRTRLQLGNTLIPANTRQYEATQLANQITAVTIICISGTTPGKFYIISFIVNDFGCV